MRTGSGEDGKKNAWTNVKFELCEDGIEANIRAQFEPQYNEFSKVPGRCTAMPLHNCEGMDS